MNDYEKEHIALLRTYAPECTVLLKKDGRFPLSAPGKLALYGSGARQTIKGGTGSGDVNSRFFVTCEEGLEEAGFSITTKSWLDKYDHARKQAHKQFVADIKRQAKEQHVMAVMLGMGAVMKEPEYELPLNGDGDTAIYVVGRISGEGNDRNPVSGDLKLTASEIRDIKACSQKYKNFLLVLNVGGVVDLSPVRQVGNILVLSQLGVVTGQILADIVLGKSVPSGKLASTWSAWEDYSAIGTFGDKEETRYKEGIYVGYRYFDSVGKKPLFPFGFGLGYTDFSIGSTTASLDGTRVTVHATVTNTGHFIGKEVVQVYVSAPWGKLDQPFQTLAGFAKTHYLAPGENETVTVSFGMESLASYDTAAAAYVLESGNYILRAGNCSSHTAACSVITLAEDVTVRKVSNVGGKPDFSDWHPAVPSEHDISGLPQLVLEPSAFAALSWPKPHEASAEAQQRAASLSDTELIHMCMGAFQEGVRGLAGVIGTASLNVAGAAGETFGGLKDVPALIMADGPAGLRLAQHYIRDEKGAHSVGSSMPAGFEDYMGVIPNLLLKLTTKRHKGEVLDQYCTAIPIGTALAQSWNLVLCEACGDLVGREMEIYHVDLWLAPAFNIHRSPLCGRNFEYYSEDPLISGLVAGAITRGVQKHPGCGTTVKHFCCNNQELNRYISNSLVSERALREIYIRGFQICIQDSAPAALMTSYNLLNGVHTSERSDLMKTLLREEWGYSGLIMTDWVISAMGAKGKYRMALSAPTIAAGNDAFMPGGSGDYKLALTALKGTDKSFKLTRQEAEYCAAHVIDSAWALKRKS